MAAGVEGVDLGKLEMKTVESWSMQGGTRVCVNSKRPPSLSHFILFSVSCTHTLTQPRPPPHPKLVVLTGEEVAAGVNHTVLPIRRAPTVLGNFDRARDS